MYVRYVYNTLFTVYKGMATADEARKRRRTYGRPYPNFMQGVPTAAYRQGKEVGATGGSLLSNTQQGNDGLVVRGIPLTNGNGAPTWSSARWNSGGATVEEWFPKPLRRSPAALAPSRELSGTTEFTPGLRGSSLWADGRVTTSINLWCDGLRVRR